MPGGWDTGRVLPMCTGAPRCRPGALNGIIVDMYTDFYSKVSAPWRRLANGRDVLSGIDRALAWLVAAVYGVVLVWLVANGDARVWKAALVPAVTFVLVSVVRAGINAPRPYEAYRIDPLITKDTRGKSMPSRHMASVVIIACALAWIDMRWGIGAVVGCAAIGYVRIASGVHFPRDIAAATALSLACAAVGFLVVP